MGIDAVGLQPSVTTVPMATMTRQENLHNFVMKGKVCNICGDAGFDNCLAICSQCNVGAEHVYCMVTIPDTVPLNWICEGCKVKQNQTCGKRRFVHDGLRPIQGYKKQILSRVASSSSAKSSSEDMGLLHNSSFKESFSEHGTKPFNSMQANKLPPRGPASQVQPRGGGNLRETSLPETNQLSCLNILTKKVGCNTSINGNSDVVAPDVNKPLPAGGVLAKAAPCSGTDIAFSFSGGHKDNETITGRDWPIVSPKVFMETISTVSKSVSEVKSADVVAPVEGALVKDTRAIALDVEVSGERLQCEEKGIINARDKLPFKTGVGNLLPVLAEHHNLDAKESSYLTEPVGVLVKDTPAIMLDIEVSCESVPCDEKECINMDLTPFKACEGNLGSAEAEHHNLGFTTGLSPFPMETSSQPGPLQGGSMKGASTSITGSVVRVCRTAPKHLTSTAEKNSVTVYKDVPNYMDLSIGRSTSNPQDAIINNAAMKTECGKFVITGRSHATKGRIARRDFPTITQKIKILGERCTEIPNFKSKGKLPQKVGAPSGVTVLSCPPLPSGGVLVKEETANEQETEASCNRLQVNEEVNVIDGSIKLSNFCCKGEKGQHQNRGVLVKEPAHGQETDGSCNGLEAKEEVNAIIGSTEPPSLLCEEAHHPSIKQKFGSAGSPYCLIKNATIAMSRISPTTISAVETNIKSVAFSYCSSKEPSSGLVPGQEESMKGASVAGTDKISGAHSKRVIRRDFPLKSQTEKVEKIAGPTGKENITGTVKTPSEVEKQVNGSKLCADNERAARRDFPAKTPKVLAGKLEKCASSTSVGNLPGEVVPPSESEDRPSCQLAKHTFNMGTDMEAVSRRLQAKEEVCENKESTVLPLLSQETKSADKAHNCTVKQECDATVLSSCVTRELPTNGASSAIRGEVASVLRKVPRDLETALKRRTIEKYGKFSSTPSKEIFSLATFNSAKRPCLPGRSGGVLLEDPSKIQVVTEKVFGGGRLSNSNGLCNILNSSLEREHVDGVEKPHIPEQDGEAVQAAVTSSCLVRKSSSHVASVQGVGVTDAPYPRPHKVAYAAKLAPSVEADLNYVGKDFLTGRNTSGSQCAFHRTAPMMGGDSQPSDFIRRKKSAVRLPVIGADESIRGKHRNSTFFGREPEDGCFHARHKGGDCEPLDRVGVTKSRVAGPRHHISMGSDLEYRTMKHDHYSRGSRSWAGDSDFYKGAYRCHRCNGVGHSTEFCEARSKGRQREWRTADSSDFDERDMPENRSDPGHVNRPFPGFHGSDGRKRWRHNPRSEEKFINRRSGVESSVVDCAGMCSKRPAKVFEHTRHDEEQWYKSQLRDEMGKERVTPRSESLHSLNGKKMDVKSSVEPSEYARVHKRQIIRVETQGNCKAGFGAPRLPESSPPLAPSSKNGKVFDGQGNASSFQPAGAPRGGYLQKLPPSQVPLTPQDEVRKETNLKTSVRSRLQGSSGKKLLQERRAVPDLQVLWTGCFSVSSTTSSSTCYEGVQAHPSTVADPKVFESLSALPLVLELEEIKRGVETDSWPRSFQEYPPTRHSIGIYFVPVDMRSHDTWFQPLLHRLFARDLALKVKLGFAQLLIFSSQLLPEAERRWNGSFFLWGIFRKNTVREAIEVSSHLMEPHSDKDHGSDLGSPKGNGEVIDVDVNMVGGEDAEWQDISPPLPPGFSPTPPHLP